MHCPTMLSLTVVMKVHLAVQLGGVEGLAVEAIEPVDHSQLTLEIVGCIWCRLECILPKKTLAAAIVFVVIKVEGIKVLILEDRHFARFEKGIHLLIPKGDSGSLFFLRICIWPTSDTKTLLNLILKCELA